MSTLQIVLMSALAGGLLVLFVVVSFRGVKTSPPDVRPVRGLVPIPKQQPPLVAPSPRPLRILLATDGSPCSDAAVTGVAMRPWPAGTRIQILNAVRTRIPDMPDLLLMVEAAHGDALEAERQMAPGRLARAEACFTGKTDVAVTSTSAEGDPVEVILDEAARWQADLIVLGSHGFGVVKRRLLGSVAQAVALQAPCSVEIVRCHERPGAPPVPRGSAQDGGLVSGIGARNS